MKTKRSLLAVAITLAAAACSGDVTAPDPSLGAAFEESSTSPTSTPAPAVAEPEPKEDGDGGLVGSGVGR